MTDARYPERWLSDRRLLRLSDADHRTFVTALVWSVSNRTDGVIEPEDVPLIAGATQGSAAALVAAGLWADHPQGWWICEFANTQTSASELEVLENGRRREREKKARQRAAARMANPDNTPPSSLVPGDVPGDGYPGTTQEGKDRARDRPVQEVLGSTSSNVVEGVTDERSTSPFRRRPAA